MRLRLVFPALALASPLVAQAPASTYLDRYNDLLRTSVTSQVADVNHVTLNRDGLRLSLERGRMALLAPVGGRTVGAVFQGDGTVRFDPMDPVERVELRRYGGDSPMEVPIREVVLLFADTTMKELSSLAFAAGEAPAGAIDHVRDLLNSFKGDKAGAYDNTIIEPMLNGDTTNFFLAYIVRARGEPLIYERDPGMVESVQLLHPVSRRQWGADWGPVTRSRPDLEVPGTAGAWVRRDRVTVPAYRVDVNLGEAISANLSVTARADLSLRVTESVGPWMLFYLHPKLDLDSATWGDGRAAAVFKADEDAAAWVRAPRRLQAGDSLQLTLYYHGGMIDRFGNFFFVDPGAAWYPIPGMGNVASTFDLTYHAPQRYPLVSSGEKVDSSLAGNVRTTRWVTRRPAQFASFNLGLFQPWHVQHEDAPALDVYLSDDAHRELREQYRRMGIMIAEQSHMKENVAADVSNALKLFTSLFGPADYDHFAVTEIPYGEGVSFPGLIHLSWSTFQNTSIDGFDEFFRAHESAHQWWGNGVRPDTYRDAWLSEGFATFYGLTYVQALRRRDTEYNHFLEQYKNDIAADVDAGPIALGFRLSTPRIPRGYDVLVYEKGAWILHMLKTMMTDLNTLRADRFTEMMREFYTSYHGRAASTADFQRVVERYTNQPMDWFFEDWVRGMTIPSYNISWSTQPNGDGRLRLRMHIEQTRVPPEFRMPMLVAVDLGNDRTARFRVVVSGAQTDYVSPLIPGEPRGVTFNAMNSVLADVHVEH